MNKFLYEYIKGMIKGLDLDSGSFELQLRDPKERNVTGMPKVLVTQIVENLRSALDFMVFELSKLNQPDLNEQTPQFVIAKSKPDFERLAKGRLKYLTDKQRSFIEQIQPYHGNVMLALLGEVAGVGKHRRLLSIRDNTGLDIYFSEIAKKHEYEGYFMYPMEKGTAIFARPKGQPIAVLMEKYDAMAMLKTMIEHTAEIVRVSFCFFQGRPLELNIIRE